MTVISSITNTHMKAFHIGTFKEDSLEEVGADLEIGADFHWWREVCSGWLLGNSVGQCVIAHLHNAYPEGIMLINISRTEFMGGECVKNLSDQVWARRQKGSE